MPECIHCGAECSFDPNIRHVCVGRQKESKDIYNPARPPADDEEPRWLLDEESESPQRVWLGMLAGHLHGALCIKEKAMPTDRQAMRQLLHERLQAFGDALLSEWEKHLPAEEKT